MPPDTLTTTSQGSPTTHTQSMPSVEDLDVENGTASGEPDLFDPETVAYDDLSYDGC